MRYQVRVPRPLLLALILSMFAIVGDSVFLTMLMGVIRGDEEKAVQRYTPPNPVDLYHPEIFPVQRYAFPNSVDRSSSAPHEMGFSIPCNPVERYALTTYPVQRYNPELVSATQLFLFLDKLISESAREFKMEFVIESSSRIGIEIRHSIGIESKPHYISTDRTIDYPYLYTDSSCRRFYAAGTWWDLSRLIYAYEMGLLGDTLEPGIGAALSSANSSYTDESIVKIISAFRSLPKDGIGPSQTMTGSGPVVRL